MRARRRAPDDAGPAQRRPQLDDLTTTDHWIERVVSGRGRLRCASLQWGAAGWWLALLGMLAAAGSGYCGEDVGIKGRMKIGLPLTQTPFSTPSVPPASRGTPRHAVSMDLPTAGGGGKSGSGGQGAMLLRKGDSEGFKIVGEKIIGNGTFGVVFEATLADGRKLAVKRVLQDARYRNRELSVMRALRHPSCVELQSYFYTSRREDPSAIYLNLVMEYLPTNLNLLIKSQASSDLDAAGGIRPRQPLPLNLTKIYAWQLLRALAYLHSVGICHRDVKPSNVLVDPATQRAKLCDFGCSKRLQPGMPSVSYVCSRFYRAPELILGASHYTTAVDMWSFGCVLAEMLIGRPLFAGDCAASQFQAITRVLGSPDAPTLEAMRPANFSAPALAAMTAERHETEGWEALRSAKAPVDAVDLLSRVLALSPDARPRAIECLAHPFFDAVRALPQLYPEEAAGALGGAGRGVHECGEGDGSLFDLTDEEVAAAEERGVLERLLPPGALRLLRAREAREAEAAAASGVGTPVSPSSALEPASSGALSALGGGGARSGGAGAEHYDI